jgi:hypothetical protein
MEMSSLDDAAEEKAAEEISALVSRLIALR